MKVGKSVEKCWALSRKFQKRRLFLGLFCWVAPPPALNMIVMGVALFETRKGARQAQKSCLYRGTRVEKVCATVEAIK